MKKLLCALLICTASLIASVLACADKDEFSKDNKEVHRIIAAHVQAAGGEVALLGMKSISRIGTIEFFEDAISEARGTFTYRTDIIYPHKIRENLSGDSILIDRGTDGSTYWEWSGAQYESVTDKLKQVAMQETAERANRDILWLAEETNDLKVAQQLPIWAGHGVCLEGQQRESRLFICFDSDTGLMSVKGNDQEYRLFSDWRRTNNILLPFRLTHFRQARKVYEINLERVEVDQVIDASTFEMPIL